VKVNQVNKTEKEGQGTEVQTMSQFTRWNQVSKYFLPSRSGEFLELEFANIMSHPERSAKFVKLFLAVPEFRGGAEQDTDTVASAVVMLAALSGGKQ